MADDEMPTAPAITNASRLPQPEREAEPDAGGDVEAEVDRSGEGQAAPARRELAEGELQPEIEQQQDEPERREELEVGRVVDQLDAGGVGPEQQARDHEERDRGETDTPAEARQQPGGEQRRAQRDECVAHAHRPGSAVRGLVGTRLQARDDVVGNREPPPVSRQLRRATPGRCRHRPHLT